MKPVVRHVPFSGFACFLCRSFRHKQKAPSHFARGLLKTENLLFLPLGTPARPRWLCRISQCLSAALHLAQRVNRLVLRFVICPRSDFPQQPDRNQLNSAQKRHRRKHQQRPMFRNHVRVKQQLLRHPKTPPHESRPSSRQPQQSEELQRPCRIIQQELHHDQVKEHSNRSSDSVIRFAALPPRVRNRHFRNSCSR